MRLVAPIAFVIAFVLAFVLVSPTTACVFAVGVPPDATMVTGSHGRRPADRKDWPVFITDRPELVGTPEIESTDVYKKMLSHLCTDRS